MVIVVGCTCTGVSEVSSGTGRAGAAAPAGKDDWIMPNAIHAHVTAQITVIRIGAFQDRRHASGAARATLTPGIVPGMLSLFCSLVNDRSVGIADTQNNQWFNATEDRPG